MGSKDGDMVYVGNTPLQQQFAVGIDIAEGHRHRLTYLGKQEKHKTQQVKEQTHRLRKQTYGYWGEALGRGIDWEFGIDMYTMLYLKQTTNKDLLCSTGNSAQYSVIT